MGPVAIRSVFGSLASANGCLARGTSIEGHGSESGSAVRSIAPRLVKRLAAAAPEIGLAFFQIDHDGGLAR